MKTKKLADLKSGQHFVFPWSGRKGRLLRLTPGSAYVEYERQRTEDGALLPPERSHISRGTEVQA